MITGLRIWVPVAVLAVVAVLAGGWLLGAQPVLASADAAGQTAATVDANNQATRMRLLTLTKQAAKIDTMQEQDALLMKAVPGILKPNTFIRLINRVAALDGVTVASVVTASASSYAPAPSLLGGSAGTAGSIPLGKVDSSISASNLTVVPVTVSVTGSYSAVTAFAHDVQSDARLFAVSGIQTTRDDDGSVAASVIGSIYTLKR